MENKYPRWQNKYTLLLAGLILLLVISSCHSSGDQSRSSGEADSLPVITQSAFGQRKTVQLPGGISVLLNSDTKLSAAQNTDSLHHELTIDGNAFFKISRDTSWTLHTGMLNLTTRGASFRIHAHREDAGQSVEVLRGKLLAEKAYPSDYPDTETLHAGDMVMINRDIDLMEKETFDTSTLISWIKDTLVLKDLSLHEAIRKLEDWYGTDIEVTGNVPPASGTTRINGQFNSESLQTVLDTLGAREKFRYTIEGGRVKIRF